MLGAVAATRNYIRGVEEFVTTCRRDQRDRHEEGTQKDNGCVNMKDESST